MLQAEILDLALSQVNDILHLISDREQREEYSEKKAVLEELIEIENEKQRRIIKEVLEGAK